MKTILKDGRKVFVKCKVVANVPGNENPKDTVLATSTRSFKVDSGSQITCIPASMLDLYISEKDFLRWADTHRTEGIKPLSVICKGIDSESVGIRGFYIQTDHFFIQDLDLGSVPIYVVFDERYRKILLGMDLLRLMNILIDNDKEEMDMVLTRKFSDYKKKHLRTTIKSMVEMGIYSDKDSNIDSIIASYNP